MNCTRLCSLFPFPPTKSWSSSLSLLSCRRKSMNNFALLSLHFTSAFCPLRQFPYTAALRMITAGISSLFAMPHSRVPRICDCTNACCSKRRVHSASARSNWVSFVGTVCHCVCSCLSVYSPHSISASHYPSSSSFLPGGCSCRIANNRAFNSTFSHPFVVTCCWPFLISSDFISIHFLYGPLHVHVCTRIDVFCVFLWVWIEFYGFSSLKGIWCWVIFTLFATSNFIRLPFWCLSICVVLESKLIWFSYQEQLP